MQPMDRVVGGDHGSVRFEEASALEPGWQWLERQHLGQSLSLRKSRLHRVGLAQGSPNTWQRLDGKEAA